MQLRFLRFWRRQSRTVTAVEANQPTNVTVGVSFGGWKLVRPDRQKLGRRRGTSSLSRPRPD